MPRVPKLKIEITADDKATKRLQQVAAGMSRAFRGVSSVAKFSAKAVAAFGAAAGAASYGVYRLTRSYSENIDQLDEQATSIGRTAQSLREWQFVAGRAGVGADQLVSAFGRFNVEVSKVRAGEGKLNKVFDQGDKASRKRGAEFKKRIVESKTLEEAQAAIFDAIREAPRHEDKERLARLAFGNAGRSLLPMLAQTNEELNAQIVLFRKLAGVYTPEQVKASSDLEDGIGELSTAFGGLRDSIGSELVTAALPNVKALTEWLTNERGKVALEIAGAIKNIATELGNVDWVGVGNAMLSTAHGLVATLGVAVDFAKLLSGDTSGVARRIGGQDIPRRAVPLPARQQESLSQFEQMLPPAEQRLRQSQRVVDRTPGSFIMGGVPESIQKSVGMSGLLRALTLATSPTKGEIVVRVQAAAGTAAEVVKTAVRSGNTGIRGM